MKIRVWGARGSVPAPGPEMVRYGGNTSCVELTFRDGHRVILDAGTGIRALGLELADASNVEILLTHLHLDHIQGLMFFPPCFRSDAEITIWGPSSPEASLENRIGRYISAPLSPVEVRELPCSVAFNEAPATEWQLGSVTIRAEAITHRGPTLGYRISDGETTICYLPDHEPALGMPLESLENEWMSGFGLARDADLLIHDCQYTDEEYPRHIGWGHSAMGDALLFADRVGAKQALLFHHDPLHTDTNLDAIGAGAKQRWTELGHDAASVELAREGMELEVVGAGPLVQGVTGQLSTAGTTSAAELST